MMNNEMMNAYKELKANGLSHSEAMDMINAMFNTKKPRSGKGSTGKADKPVKVYEHFEKSFNGYAVKSEPSKNGNPDAVLVITFDEIPSESVRTYIKGCGFKFSKEKGWYRNNVKFAHKAVELIGMVDSND